jgi:hypothetical protein
VALAFDAYQSDCVSLANVSDESVVRTNARLSAHFIFVQPVKNPGYVFGLQGTRCAKSNIDSEYPKNENLNLKYALKIRVTSEGNHLSSECYQDTLSHFLIFSTTVFLLCPQVLRFQKEISVFSEHCPNGISAARHAAHELLTIRDD